MVNDCDITFVIQGRVVDLTKETIASIRRLFPGSKIFLSTWKGQCLDGFFVDKIIENDDVGPTVIEYDKNDKPRVVNINRQIVSTINGLKLVDTKFAVKIRSDNYLTNRAMIKYFNTFDNYRDSEYSLFERRIITSNYFAKEYTRGLVIPFSISDFFQFGLTKDLINLWDISLFDDYIFNDEFSGHSQHENLPFRQHHIEQMLWVKFINKHRKIVLKNKFGNPELNELFYKLMLNNTVIVDGKLLGLSVPKRLEQHDGFPYENFTHLRWHYLYKKYFNMPINDSNKIVIKWSIAKCYSFLKSGLRTKLKDRIRYISSSFKT